MTLYVSCLLIEEGNDSSIEHTNINLICYILHTFIILICVILQALVDGPCTGVGRQVINFKLLHPTKLTINISHSARKGTVKKAWIKDEIEKKWSETKWAQKIAAKEKVSSGASLWYLMLNCGFCSKL